MVKGNPKRNEMLLTEDVRTLIPKMAVPTIIAQLITVVYNLTDTFFVSRIGTTATAAVGVNNTIELTINMLGMMIGVGASSYIARLLGGKDGKHANQVFTTSLALSVVFSVILAALGLIFIEPLVNVLGADANCRDYSIQYGTYVFMAAPFMVVSYELNQCLRSEGSATRAMTGIGFGGILNCFLDPVFIFYMDLGVKGASIATAISKVVSCGILLYPYLMKRSVVELSMRNFKVTAGDMKEVISIGSSSFFRSACGVLASTLMNRAARDVSTAMLAAISVSNRVMQFPFNIILGFGQGYQPVVGFNWGAKRYDRTEESLGFASKVSLIGGAVMGVLGFLFAGQIIGIFNSQADAGVMQMGMLCIRLQCVALPIHAYLSMVNMFYAGIGKPRQAMLLSLARQGYCFWPLIILLPLVFGGMGLTGVQAGADLLSLLAALPLGLSAKKLIRTKMREAELAGR